MRELLNGNYLMTAVLNWHYLVIGNIDVNATPAISLINP